MDQVKALSEVQSIILQSVSIETPPQVDQGEKAIHTARIRLSKNDPPNFLFAVTMDGEAISPEKIDFERVVSALKGVQGKQIGFSGGRRDWATVSGRYEGYPIQVWFRVK